MGPVGSFQGLSGLCLAFELIDTHPHTIANKQAPPSQVLELEQPERGGLDHTPQSEHQANPFV